MQIHQHTCNPFAAVQNPGHCAWHGNQMGPQMMTPDIHDDLVFMSLMVREATTMVGMDAVDVGRHLVQCGFGGMFYTERRLVIEAFAQNAKYSTVRDIVGSPHRHFIVRAIGAPTVGETLKQYLCLVVGFDVNVAHPMDLQALADACRMADAVSRSQGLGQLVQGNFVPRHVYRQVVSPVRMDHGFRPRRLNGIQAGNNSVFIYHPDLAPMIATAEMETTYRINGYCVLFHMNNFSCVEDVEVEVHESVRNELPGLLATEMDGAAFRRYFLPSKRIENTKALASVIK